MALLPMRMGHSAALRDCADLFLSAWANFQRGLPCAAVTDGRLYAKALRSLRCALDDQQTPGVDIVAALTLLERHEIMFDLSRPFYHSIHTGGLCAVMERRGPPNPSDELDVQLNLANYSLLVRYLHH